jgi:hypothetical protein
MRRFVSEDKNGIIYINFQFSIFNFQTIFNALISNLILIENLKIITLFRN